METIIVSVNNKSDASFLLRLLKRLNFVKEIKHKDENYASSAYFTDDNAIQIPKQTGSISSSSVIWKDYDISIETIRKKAWDKN